MADDNSRQYQSNDRPINSACTPGLYQLQNGATSIDVLDQLETRIYQLSAMLTMTCGAGFETFDGWNDRIKSDYLWACSMMADECRELMQYAAPTLAFPDPADSAG